MAPRQLLLGICGLALLLPACKSEKPLEKQPAVVKTAQHAAPPKPAPEPEPEPEPEDEPPPGAHPDYPTAAAAGTGRLFFAGEPDRGPHVTSVALPDEGSLSWTRHAHCELEPTDIVCGAATAEHAPGAWRVGRRGGAVVTAQLVVGSGPLETYHFRRDAGGKPSQLVMQDPYGVIVWARSFTGGRYKQRRLDGGNALAGCGQMGFKLDGRGLSTELACLQWNGRSMRDERGVRVTRFARDGRGFVSSETYLSARGGPMTDNDGVHRRTLLRDARGRVTEVRNLGIEGKPVRSTRTGCHGLRYERDGRGLVRRRICLDAGGKAAADRSQVAIRAYDVEASGCWTAVRYLDAAGRPTANHHGVRGVRFKLDARCTPLVRACRGPAGGRVACGPGAPARFVYRRDRQGRVRATRHHNAAGGPGQDSAYGVFEVRRELDRLGRLVAESCFDPGGRLVDCGLTGYHRTTQRRDDAGRVVEARFFDPAGKPTTNVGTPLRRFRHDSYDHVYEATDHDFAGRVIEAQGKTTFRTLYDQRHRLFAIVLLDRQGKPARYHGCYTGVDCPSGEWHAVRIDRSPRGRVLRNRYFDSMGRLAATIDCAAHRCWDGDPWGGGARHERVIGR